MQWMTESERMITCLEQHDWWQRHPKQLRETVRDRAEELAAAEGKNVYQQHVLRAAAEGIPADCDAGVRLGARRLDRQGVTGAA